MREMEVQYANIIPTLFLGLILLLFLTGGTFLGPLVTGIRDLLLGI